MNKRIIINTEFIATHSWPGCDIKEVDYLKHEHRHTFKVCLKFNVSHNDRDIEFIVEKRKIDNLLQEHFANKHLGARSCEDIAEELLLHFNAEYVSVSEDGENGAEVWR